jgi:hypothetical protein
MTQYGLPADQRTMTTVDGIEPIPGMEVCDFCTSTPVVAGYPCGLVVIETPAGIQASRTPWAACELCAPLIDAGDRDGLVERALGGFIVENGELPEGMCAPLRAILRDAHAQFFANREGEASRFTM